jgi:hypothetical protein
MAMGARIGLIAAAIGLLALGVGDGRAQQAPGFSAGSALGQGAAAMRPAAPVPAAAAPGTVRLQRAELVDPSGFERPMVAATILVPAGWRAQGGVVWTPANACGSAYSFNWRATAPDGVTAVAVFPGTSWTFSNMPLGGACTTSRATSARQYLEALAQRARPGARILDFRARKDLLEGLAALNSTTPMPLGELQSWVDAGEVLIAASEQGRPTRESIAAVVIFSRSRINGVGGQTMESVTGTALPGFWARAPEGQLDFRLAETIRASFRTAPEWQQRINAHERENSRIAAAGAQRRHEIRTQTNREIADMQQRGWEARQASQDRRHREFIETIRGVETYNDPSSATGTVQLSNQYSNAWRMNDGSYVLTDDPSFNPYAATGQEGVRLSPAR